MTTREETAKTFRYQKPDSEEDRRKKKSAVILSLTDVQVAAVQVVRSGSETKLHSCRNMDGLWFVLEGRARFYSTDDEVVGELGKHEGVVIPRGYPYWFESVGDDELEILQVESF